jgi:hypothetical protein
VEKVMSYAKPLFIIIMAIEVIFTHYAAVFPLLEATDFFLRRARGRRNEELLHGNQMIALLGGLEGCCGRSAHDRVL